MKLFFSKIAIIFLLLFISTPFLYAQKNIEIIFDSSGSMNESIQGKKKIDIAKEVFEDFIQDIPKDINLGLRIYGHRFAKDCTDTDLVIPIGRVNKDVFLKNIKDLIPTGMTPIAFSLEEAGKDFSGLSGENTIILISDGEETCEGAPCTVAEELAKSGIKVKIHTVGFALATESAKRQLECIALISGGKYFDAKDAQGLEKSLEEIKKITTTKIKVKLDRATINFKYPPKAPLFIDLVDSETKDRVEYLSPHLSPGLTTTLTPGSYSFSIAPGTANMALSLVTYTKKFYDFTLESGEDKTISFGEIRVDFKIKVSATTTEKFEIYDLDSGEKVAESIIHSMGGSSRWFVVLPGRYKIVQISGYKGKPVDIVPEIEVSPLEVVELEIE